MLSHYDIVIISGYFNPLHVGHIEYINAAKSYGSTLIAIVNNDSQVGVKESKPFMLEGERLAIIQALRAVDVAVLSLDKTQSVLKTLQQIVDINRDCKILFATGADHTPDNTQIEKKLCERIGIDIKYGVGGSKIQSSSGLLRYL